MQPMAEWGCGEYTECPCGCGWAVCSVFGEWIEPSDCADCEYRDDYLEDDMISTGLYDPEDGKGEGDAGSGD